MKYNYIYQNLSLILKKFKLLQKIVWKKSFSVKEANFSKIKKQKGLFIVDVLHILK